MIKITYKHIYSYSTSLRLLGAGSPDCNRRAIQLPHTHTAIATKKWSSLNEIYRQSKAITLRIPTQPYRRRSQIVIVWTDELQTLSMFDLIWTATRNFHT